MTNYTKNYHSNSNLTLLDSTHCPLPIHSPTLTIIQQNDTPIECRLTFQITPQLYQQIETQSLFNLKPELRGSLANGNFQPQPNIEIEATLQPDLLPHLTENITNPDAAITYLQNISQSEPENPLLSTENWFALQVKQPQESGETGYRTFWYYVNPSTLTKENISSEEITEAMVNFFSDWTDTNLSDLSQNTFTQTFDSLTQAFQELADTTLTATTDTLTEILEDISNTFEELIDIPDEDIPEDIPANRTIFEAMVNFFTEDDWGYAKIKEQPSLRLAFEGKNGKWTCYAKAREKQRQFLFYSICPITAPKNKRKTLAEFITRVNSGMVIGNFELDFDSGEICYKTSLEIHSDLLSFALIKSLVYPNVRMMDKYLPGIQSIIFDKITPESAIRLIEEIEVSPPSSNSAPSNNLSDQITPESAIQLIESSQVSPPPSNSAPSNNLTDELPIVIPKSKKKTKSKPSPPTESQTPSEKRVTESDILSRLTQSDLLKFEKISQLKGKFEKPMPQSILEGIKTELITRLGEEGSEIFTLSHQIFAASNFDARQIRFIRRYSELEHLIQVQIEEVISQSSGDEDFEPTLEKWEKMKLSTKDRLQQIAKYDISPQQEIDMLMEITRIREELAVAKKKS
ncbi:YbjN domain-containing protein [Limnofasciculus baicalensis]|uniref:YbjN domain-containing protein n=1 Tax=Limnofasciculus baicalensis BBK-W-15 TaxID=2699891 RepID=A0AAE3GU81_9CYAN|nr:YbjN domain-containing protein [Limnofasciculus baicalensis]MCP2730152.1 YbjN domain-containing protein [Limnofasciculus baicalensis BBK-W-15]